MVFNFLMVIVILLVVGQYKKHKTTIEWPFEAFAVIPIFRIFCCIFFMLSRKDKRNDIKFIGFTKNFTLLRKVFFVFSCVISLLFVAMLVVQFLSDEAWERLEQIKFFASLASIFAAGIAFLLFLYQNSKVGFVT